MAIDPLSALNPFSNVPDPKSDKWYVAYVKPAVMLVAFMMFSYATLWMGQHYVTQDKFSVYVEKQIEHEKIAAQEAEKRFEVTQDKLETIINNQGIFSEDLKHINQTQAALDKRLDNMDNRIIYLERQLKITSPISN